MDNDKYCKMCGIMSGDVDVYNSNALVEDGKEVPYDSDEFAVFPDAAPLGYGHVLVVPKAHVLSMARLPKSQQRQTLSLARSFVGHVSEEHEWGKYTPFFLEHGSCEEDQEVGCSITHAHFHVFFQHDDALDDADILDELHEFEDVEAAWDHVGESDYYLLGEFGENAYGSKVAEAAELKCTMLLRKLFARQLDDPNIADYQRYESESANTDALFHTVEETHELLSNDEFDLTAVSSVPN